MVDIARYDAIVVGRLLLTVSQMRGCRIAELFDAGGLAIVL